jgi:mannose/fructose/N-acetylgalactosamine-specific phosphotransferase system component IIB
MAVVHLRIDNRLVHGQVTVVWTAHLRAARIVVANDEVAADDLQRALLPQAARGLPTDVLGVEAAAARCAESGDERVMVIAKHPEDAFRLVAAGCRPPEVTVGNAAPVPGVSAKKVTRSVALTAAQAEGFRKLAAAGTPVVSQLLPRDKPADFVALLAKKGL